MAGKLNNISVDSFSKMALPHLSAVLEKNSAVMKRVAEALAGDVTKGKSLFVFGSGHSGLLPLELYHRAGGPSFIIPVVADYLLPNAGPPLVRLMERNPLSGVVLLNRVQPRSGEMIWLASQSGINPAVVELALEAKRRGMTTVAFTSVVHSQSVESRHASKSKLFEICDEVVDYGGVVGDAAVAINTAVSAGPLSTLTGIFLAHSILVGAIAELENAGIRCSYSSVNTPTGEARNRELEEQAKIRDPFLR